MLTGPAGPPGSITRSDSGSGLGGRRHEGQRHAESVDNVLQRTGSAMERSTWVCATAKGTGTITGVTAGTDLTGGGTSGNGHIESRHDQSSATDVEQRLQREPDIFRQRRHRSRRQHEQLHAINGRHRKQLRNLAGNCEQQ